MNCQFERISNNISLQIYISIVTLNQNAWYKFVDRELNNRHYLITAVLSKHWKWGYVYNTSFPTLLYSRNTGCKEHTCHRTYTSHNIQWSIYKLKLHAWSNLKEQKRLSINYSQFWIVFQDVKDITGLFQHLSFSFWCLLLVLHLADFSVDVVTLNYKRQNFIRFERKLE